jgi:V/A-type H+-transporting ATPase subunit C
MGQSTLDFYSYPSVGTEDWRYGYETALVRTLEMHMLSRAHLQDMANAENFERAADLLTGTEYALPQGSSSLADVEALLQERRSAVRGLFAELIIDDEIVDLFRSRDDFANLRLALRRTVTERELGSDYSSDGNVDPELFEAMLSDEDKAGAGDKFPAYVNDAVEEAVLGYYQDKDIRRIDYAIDASQARYNLARAAELDSPFLTGLFRIQIDLTNVRTLLRLKFTESEQRNVLIEGGFIETERFRAGIDAGYETLGSLFFATPYSKVVETSASYVAANNSFLKVEQQCDEHLAGYLHETAQITAGPQPIIAYLLNKENEIRRVRLLLTAKKSSLGAKLILDRIS